MSTAPKTNMIVLLTSLTAIGPISTSIYLPSLPALAADLGASAGEAQLTLTASLIGFALLQLVYGPLSDRYGRRLALFGGLTLYVAASAACALAPTIGALILARFVQGVGGCAGSVISRAVVRDLFTPTEGARVLAYIGMALAVAPAVGPLIGGQLEVYFGWRATFVAVGAAGLAILIFAFLRLPETNQGASRGTPLWRIVGGYWRLLRSGTFMAYSLSVGFQFGGLFAFQAGAPMVLIGMLGVRPDAYGLYTLVPVCGYVLGGFISTRISARLGILRMVRLGAAVNLAGGLLIAILAVAVDLNVVMLIGPMFFFSIGMGLLLPNAMAGAIANFPEIAGTASALLGFFMMGTGALGSAMVVVLPHASQAPMTLVVAGMALCACLAVLRLRGTRTPPV